MAQSLLVVEDELLSGVGTFALFDGMDVNNAGDWLVEGIINISPTQGGNCVIGPSGLLWLAGQATPTPAQPGATLLQLQSVSINNAGAVGLNMYLDPPVFPYDAVYYNGSLVLEEGDDAASWTGTPAGSTWAVVWQVCANDNNQLLVSGVVRLPSGGTGPNSLSVLTRLDLDASGAILSATPIAVEGDSLPGLGAINSFANNQAHMTMSNSGDVIFTAIRNVQFGNTWGCYLWSAGSSTLLAQVGTPTSFDPNRNWQQLRAVDLNDNGEFVLSGYLTGSTPGRQVLVKNGALYRATGDPMPSMPQYQFAFAPAFGSGWVHIDNSGNIFHYGIWNHPDNSIRRGLFRNDELILQHGVSIIDGTTLFSLLFGVHGVEVSDSGRFVMFKANLSDGREVIAMLDLDEGDSFCFGDGGAAPGCTDCPCGNNAAPGSMGGCVNSRGASAQLLGSGTVTPGNDTLRFEVEGATANSFGILMSADNQLPNAGACPPGSGIPAVVFDGLRCVGGAVQRHGTRASDSNGEIGISNSGWGPPNGPLGGIAAQSGFALGQTRHFQCVYRESPARACQTGQNTTNAVSVTF